MRNFLKFGNVDTVPLLLAVYRQQELFRVNTIRQDFPGSPHGETETIILRFNDYTPDKDTVVGQVIDDIECHDTPEYDRLPEARQLVSWLMARVNGERIGRAIIVRLPKGASVAPHKDQGAPATYYERFHIPLQAFPGVQFSCGDEDDEIETVEMRSGEVWWFNNAKTHAILNGSEDDRIHLIADIKCSASPAGG